jgi:hypothetical protein
LPDWATSAELVSNFHRVVIGSPQALAGQLSIFRLGKEYTNGARDDQIGRSRSF